MILDARECQNIAERALSLAESQCDAADLLINSNEISTCRFSNDGISQHQSPSIASLSLRLISKGRQVRYVTQNLSQSGLKAAFEKTASLLKFSLSSSEVVIPEEDEVSSAEQNRFDSETAGLDAIQRSKQANLILNVADKYAHRCGGFLSTGAESICVSNSRGLFRYHKESRAIFSATMATVNSSAWIKEESSSLRQLDLSKRAEEVSARASQGRNPLSLPPGRFTVVLFPSAVRELLWFLLEDFTATRYMDNLGSLRNQLSKRVFAENVNIEDNVFHPLQGGAAFDSEGQNRRRVTLVRNGVLEGLVAGSRAARKLSIASTGHSLPAPNDQGEYPINIVMHGDDNSIDDLIAATDYGILVSRVWYVRMVDPQKLLLTGLSRDGTFLIKDGNLKHGLVNMRFNISLLDLLNNITMLSRAIRASGERPYYSVVPAIKVEDFNFTASCYAD